MTAQELARKNGKASELRVFKVADGQYFVESSKNNICYKVTADNGAKGCTCPDFQKHVGKSASYMCKHIVAVMNCNGDAEEVHALKQENYRLDSRFITNVSGKEFVLYAGLLDLAHQKGIRKIHVEPEQFPTKENGNVAICKAVVESVNGEVFVEWGDADPSNVNRMISKHLLRMAATRAKARALRDFSNIGMTCLEELAELDEVIPEQKQGNVTQISNKASSKKKAKKESKSVHDDGKKEREPVVVKQEKRHPSSAQLKAIENLAKRRGISTKELEEMSLVQFGVVYTHIPPSDAAVFIRTLQQSA